MADSSFNVKLDDGVSGPANKAAAAMAKMAAEAEKLSKIKNAFEGITGKSVSDSQFKQFTDMAEKLDKSSPMAKIKEAIGAKLQPGFGGSILGAGIQKLAEGSPALAAMTSRLGTLGLGFEQLGAAAASAGSMIASGFVAGILAGVAAVSALVIGIGVATAKFASMAIQVGSFREKNLLSMEVLLKSAEASKRVYAEAVKFAAATPFETAEVVTMFKQLISAGFKEGELKRVATAIGDAAASAGGGPEVISSVTRALGQIRAKGRLQMEELLQLTESGAVGQTQVFEQIAIAMGTTVDKVPKLIEGGKVKGEAAIEAVIRAIEATRGGTMAKLERTFEGASSTFKSLPFDLFNKAFEDDKGGMAQFQKSVTEILLTLNQAFSPNSEGGKTIVKFLNGFASGLAVVSKLVLALVQGFTKGLGLDKLVSSTKGLADIDPKNVEQLGRDLSQVGEGAGKIVRSIIWLNEQLVLAIVWLSQFQVALYAVAAVVAAVAVLVGILAVAIGVVLVGALLVFSVPILITIALLAAIVAGMYMVIDAIVSLAGEFQNSGVNAVQGFIDGMASMIPNAVSTAASMAQQVAGAVVGTLQIGSPSKLMQAYGGYTAEGMSIGMEAGSPEVAASASQMSAAVTQGAARGTNAAGGGGSGIQIGSITITASGGNAEAIKTSILEAFEQIAVEFGAVGA